MYTPRSFRVDDAATLHSLIRENAFGVLVSQDQGRPLASHLPFSLDLDRGGSNGVLVGHMARANPQWKTWSADTEVLVIFQGPHAYITPDWYELKQTVPTWNYAAVHAYGRPRLIHDPEELRPMVMPMVGVYEGKVGSGWDPESMEPIMASMLKAVVGFEIPIDSLEGKFKFNQNRSREDQHGVVKGLERLGDPAALDVARIMRRNLESEGGSVGE